MHKTYADGSEIEECSARVTGGLTILLDKADDLDGLQALCLENSDLASILKWISNYDKWIEWFDANRKDYIARLGRFDETQGAVHPDNLSDVARFAIALRIAKEIWTATPTEDAENLRVLASVTSGTGDLDYQAKWPALVLHHGSLLVSFTAFVTHLGFVIRTGKFLVGLAPKAGTLASVTAEEMVSQLRNAAISHAKHSDLKRLQDLKPDEANAKAGVIILLHGLASTDVGTFDGFLDLWEEPLTSPSRSPLDKAIRQALLLDYLVVGWPHDTLTSISTNADRLFEDILSKIKQDGPPIVLVCHSRGGLLARKLAVIMQKKGGSWPEKIKLCATFGTPHRGAELAEHPYRFMGAFAGVMSQDKKMLSIFRLLSYYAQQKGFEGIEDLRPAEARGEFLRKLQEEERQLAKPDELRKLKILAVGGTYRGPQRHWMKVMTRMLGTVEHDLVVRKKSSAPEGFEIAGSPSCSHFEYFSASQIREEYFKKVVQAAKDVLMFDKAAAKRHVPTARSPTAEPGTLGGVKL